MDAIVQNEQLRSELTPSKMLELNLKLPSQGMLHGQAVNVCSKRHIHDPHPGIVVVKGDLRIGLSPFDLMRRQVAYFVDSIPGQITLSDRLKNLSLLVLARLFLKVDEDEIAAPDSLVIGRSAHHSLLRGQLPVASRDRSDMHAFSKTSTGKDSNGRVGCLDYYICPLYR